MIFNKIKQKMKFYIVNCTSSFLFSSNIRVSVYKMCGMNIGNKVFIHTNCFFNDTDIKIGNGSFINHNCVFENSSPLEIGENCSIGMQVLFCDVTHEIGREEKRVGKTLKKPIKVADGCWIGSRVTILPGVVIGKGCVIGAGSLVNKDCEPNGLYIGVPAKRVKNLPC